MTARMQASSFEGSDAGHMPGWSGLSWFPREIYLATEIRPQNRAAAWGKEQGDPFHLCFQPRFPRAGLGWENGYTGTRVYLALLCKSWPQLGSRGEAIPYLCLNLRRQTDNLRQGCVRAGAPVLAGSLSLQLPAARGSPLRSANKPVARPSQPVRPEPLAAAVSHPAPRRTADF